jgi:hypothetical protein
MAVSLTDIVVYGAANTAEADGSTHGGAINTAVRYVFSDSTLANTLNTNIKAYSSLAADDSHLAIVGRDSTGVIVSGIVPLSGVTTVTNHVTFERILKLKSLGGTHHGTISVSGVGTSAILGAMESGVNEIRRPFYNVSADPSSGSSKDFYEKVFVKNNNATNALLEVTVAESGDPTGKVTFALASGQNDTQSIANRRSTPPTFITSDGFSSSDKTIPGTNLLPSSGIGVWLKLTLAAGDSATKSTYTLGVNGNTT